MTTDPTSLVNGLTEAIRQLNERHQHLMSVQVSADHADEWQQDVAANDEMLASLHRQLKAAEATEG